MKKVKWQYTHSLGGNSKSEVVKFGEYYGKVKHQLNYWSKPGTKQMAVVKFEGNKSYSKVPFDELIFI